MTGRPPIRSFVAVGDSFTEGLQDELTVAGRHRGWADRVAAALALRHGGLGYANLAVRGRLLDAVVAEQVPVALDLAPDLVSFHAGPNDVLRPGFAVDEVAHAYDRAVRRLRARSEVVLFTVIGRRGGGGGLTRTLGRRFAAFNDVVRAAARRHDVVLVDAGDVAALGDPRLWHEDRLHLNEAGHRRIAAAVLEALGEADEALLGGSPGWWRRPLPAPTAAPWPAHVAAEARWIGRHLAPWVGRRLRGVSSGDGLAPKHPTLTQLRAP